MFHVTTNPLSATSRKPVTLQSGHFATCIKGLYAHHMPSGSDVIRLRHLPCIILYASLSLCPSHMWLCHQRRGGLFVSWTKSANVRSLKLMKKPKNYGDAGGVKGKQKHLVHLVSVVYTTALPHLHARMALGRPLTSKKEVTYCTHTGVSVSQELAEKLPHMNISDLTHLSFVLIKIWPYSKDELNPFRSLRCG